MWEVGLEMREEGKPRSLLGLGTVLALGEVAQRHTIKEMSRL